MTNANDLAKLVPGFNFLQGLLKTGGVGLPSMGQWIAPTLEVEELQRRIDELRTVQFWLEQNGKLIGTTIQALEVQRMTLATLKGMNLPLAELTESLMIRKPKAATASAAPSATSSAASAMHSAAGKPAPASRAKLGVAGTAAPIDPMQWWGALTQQFTELATQAFKDGSAEVARKAAGAAVKQGIDSAGDSIERAMAMSGKAATLAAQAGAAVAGKALGRAAKPVRRRKG